ncbi:MAG: Cyclic di-GMP phosphodiesterase response regulator RpfG [Firmicutes bacterium]|nr:Cyclic di-GMP phosphodiesterase response regulator RpfG [candidate division NPL-UPA2 bacterium]
MHVETDRTSTSKGLNMRRVPTTFLKPGMCVARPVYGSAGQALLQRNVMLTHRYISQLKGLGVPFLYIEDGLLDGYRVDDVIADETRAGAVHRVRNLVAAMETPNPLAHVLMRTKEVARTVDTIVEELFRQREIMVNLTDIRLEDDYLFGHSVNVCVLAIITGIAYGLNKEQLSHLGIGAIMLDVGMSVIPQTILRKPSLLTVPEFEAVKQHTTAGYEILTALPQARDVAHEHHERYDGSGYPQGKKGNQTQLHAQLVSICDVYDAVTAVRAHRPAYPPHEALELIAGSGNRAFPLELIAKFLENVAAYPTGVVVKFSDNRVGIVVDTPKGLYKYPRVRMLYDQQGQPYPAPYEVSTAEHPTLVVSRILSEAEFSLYRRPKYAQN